MSALSQTMQ